MVDLHIAGKGNLVADALPRFSFRVRCLDSYPERELRRERRTEVNRRCGVIDADMPASDDVPDA